MLGIFFWGALALFLAWDWIGSDPVDRFAEPPLIAAGSGVSTSGGHCSAAPR
jgi:hypothetical protein